MQGYQSGQMGQTQENIEQSADLVSSEVRILSPAFQGWKISLKWDLALPKYAPVAQPG